MKATLKNRRLRLVEPSSPSSQAASEPPPALDPTQRASEPAAPFADPCPGARVGMGDLPPNPLSALSDAQLVALGLKAQTSALEALYRRHASFAINLAARIEGSSCDVEDIAHDSFLRAFERLADLSEPSAFRSWLGAIVVHNVRSRMRRTRLMSALGMGGGAEPVDIDALASADASPATRAQIAQLYALVRTLPADECIAWTLRCVEGHDLESVAQMTRCSLATVKRRISRAQHFLDEHFVDSDVQEVSS